jgi:CBS domain-containing protein
MTADARAAEALYGRCMTAITNSPLSTATVGAVMAPGIVTCPRRASLTVVAALMSVHQVHAVVVDPGSPRVVTAHDLVRATLAGAADVDAIAAVPPWAAPDETPQAIAERMVATNAAHILVREHPDGAARGVVSSFDVAAVVAGHDPHSARVVRPAPARPAISSGRLDLHTVREVMHRGVILCPPYASLSEVAAAMVERRTHTVMVARGTGWSFVSDMDVVAAAALGDLSLPASELAPDEPHALVGADEKLDAVAHAIVEGPLGHVVAIDGDGLPVGVVSTLDIVDVIAAG